MRRLTGLSEAARRIGLNGVSKELDLVVGDARTALRLVSKKSP